MDGIFYNAIKFIILIKPIESANVSEMICQSIFNPFVRSIQTGATKISYLGSRNKIKQVKYPYEIHLLFVA